MSAFIERTLFNANAKGSTQLTAMIVVGAAYWLLVQFGLLLVIRPEGVASIWPVSGFALAILLLSPEQMRVKYLAIFFITNAAGNFYGGNSFPVSVGFALANCFESVVGAAIILYISKSKISFERTIEIFALFVAAIIGNALTALPGAAVSFFASGAPFFDTWKLWWSADGLGIIVVAPFIVTWVNKRTVVISSDRSRLFEFAFTAFILITFSWLLFGSFTVAERPLLRTFMLFPILIWSAFRFSIRSMASSLLLISIIAVWNTILGHGTFAFIHQTASQNLVSLQIFLTVAVFSGLFLNTMILDRKQAEIALRQSEKKLIEANKIAELGNWELNLRTSRLSWSEGIYEIFEIDRNTFDATYDAFLRAIHPDDRDRVNAAYTESLNNKRPYEISHRLRMPDGRIKWVNERCQTDYDDQGVAIRSFGIVQDITERKRADENQHKSEEQFRDLFQLAPIALAFVRDDGKINFVNNSFTAILGYTQSDIPTSEKWFELAYRNNSNRTGIMKDWNDAVQKVIKDGGTIESREYNITCKNGEERTMLISGAFIGQNLLVTFVDNTERNNAEEKIRKSKEEFQSYFEMGSIGMCITSPEKGWIEVNDRLCQMLGYTKKEIIQFTWSELTYPEDLNADLELFNEVIEGKRNSYETDKRFIRKDGSTIHTHLSVTCQRNQDGSVDHFLASILDINERKQNDLLNEGRLRLIAFAETHSTDEILRETLDELELLTDSTIGFYHFLEADQETLTLQNWSSRTLKEMCTAEGKHSHYHISKAGVWADSIRTRGPVIHNNYASLADKKGMPEGHAEVIRELIVPVFRNKKIVAILGIGNKPIDYTERDVEIVSKFADMAWEITERKRTEEALTASEQKYRKLVENSAIGVFQSKVSGDIIYVNHAVAAILEFEDREELIMLGSFVRYKHPEHREELIRHLKTNGRIENYEAELLTKHGNIRIVLFNIVINNEILDGTIVDITDRKNAEQALRNAQKLESIGTLAGGIAHDFNNLMNAVLGQSALALNKLPKESPAVDHITKAMKASERVADLTKQLLAYSGRGRFYVSEIDLNKLVKENVQILEVSIPKTTKLRYDLGSPSPHIKGDISQIQQVIMNLIINAGEAMDPNPGTIILRTNRIEIDQENNEYSQFTASPLEAGSYALLQVRDTGSGISQETLARIFDPFFTTKFTGRGLGLAAVLGIIKGHKGGLRIESEEGKGTMFEIVFPLITSSMAAEVPAKEKPLVTKGEGKSILVIDDEASVIELLTDVLTENNFTVMSALDPVKGIEIYRLHHQDISMVVLDYSMPVMDGKAAFHELLKINKEVKVLLCSGYSEEETLSVFGMDRPKEFLQKPYKPEIFEQRITEILSKEHLS